MTWAKLDDSFPDHPKVIGLSVDAKWLFVEGLCWCNRNLTDGVIAPAAGRRLGATKKSIAELVDVGLWELCEDPADGWVVHDYLDYQPSREKVLAEREAGRARKAKHDAKKKAARSNGRGNGVTPDVTNVGSNSPPVPVPSRHLEKSSVTEPHPATSSDDDDGLDPGLVAAVVALKVAGQTPVNPGPYRAAVARSVPVEHGDDLRRVLSEHPAWPAHWVAAHTLGMPRTDPTPSEVHDACPDCVNGLVDTGAGMAACPSCSWARNGNRTEAVS